MFVRIILPLILVLLISLSGCVSTQTGGGLSMKLQPDPAQIFSGSTTRVSIDLENNNPREITDIVFDVFDTGRLIKLTDDDNSVCSDGRASLISVMKPETFKSYYCTLAAPFIEEPSITSQISAKVSYTTYLPSVQVVNLMSENEYLTRRATGSVVTMPQSYSYQDSNVQIAVDFSEPLPVIIRSGKDYFVYFTIRNIGDGLIESLDKGDFMVYPVRSDGPRIVDCANSIDAATWHLDPVGKEFPKIACRLVLPEGVGVVENYGLRVDLNYRYEVRQSATVDIIR
jgi:hypothetical protein